ncbi:NERD domain-containing protein [Clostridium sp. 1001275B_160808_H3]|uniref:NERD domain-containing protein n=1 Tax=Clostridium sp. 1001275B_160808_H3 TaxID=2787110 RepID=UPI0018998426|nr:NERD domain-containing protein [Clostridium sp. 1001275B_160808_H3]
MALFNKLDKPIFLKEESESKYYISKLKELHSRAPEGLKGKIEKELKIATLGEFGENNIAFELKNSGIPMYILHDICLESEDLSAQIDYIVVTRKVIFIIECKNLIGNIEINSQGNFIRTYNFNGRFIKEGIYSPITQNERHLEVLKRIKKESKSNFISKFLFDKYFNDNYKSIVVLANPKTVLNSRYAKKEIKDKVVKADQLISYMKEVNAKSELMALSDKEMKDVAEQLLALHNPSKLSFLKKYRELIELVDAYNDKENNKTILKDKFKDTEKINENSIYNLQSNTVNKDNNYITNNIDKQMTNLLEKMPKTKSELKDVSGFGEVKIEKYGDGILKILNE